MANSTPNLDIAHIATNQNQKEATANTAFDDLDTAMTDQISIDVSAGGTITPTPGDVIHAFSLKFIGTMIGDATVVVPDNKHLYRLEHASINPSIGDYTITVKVAGQTGVVLNPGDKKLVYVDGTDVQAFN
ncbi:MAG TPA: hypothetical protein VNW47_09465 [Terriglobales bacterium]|jgi:hypothetical protein|nr:hypothetical protein [Terriglobales bacterium]